MQPILHDDTFYCMVQTISSVVRNEVDGKITDFVLQDMTDISEEQMFFCCKVVFDTVREFRW